MVRFPVPLKSGQQIAQARTDVPFALSPDGTRIAYAAIDSGASTWTMHLRALDQLITTAFPGTEGAITPFFSPDGLSIGFVTTSNDIKKVAVSGGPVSPLATVADRSLGAPSWGDDHAIVFTTNGLPMRIADGGGALTPLFDSTKVQMRGIAPFVLPGSRAALFTMCRNPATCDGDLAVIEVATHNVKVLVPGASRGWYLPSGHLVYSTKQGALFAVKFDLRSLAVASAPVAVLDGIRVASVFSLPSVAISASGSLAYLPGGANVANMIVVQVYRTGREDVIVSKPGFYLAPRLSPDGRRLALGSLDATNIPQVWIHDRASGTTRQLTFDGTSVRPAWSPDGSRVAFSTQRGGGVWHIWSAPADGSGPGGREGEGPDVLGASAVSWTRDGKWIVIDGPPDDKKGPGAEDIFAIPTSGSPRTMRPAVASPFNEQSGEVSPDGKWIAYASDETGKYQVYVQPFLAPGGRTLISAGRASEAVWMSNTELAYMNNETDSVTVARLEFGATIKVTRTALFDTRMYFKGSQSSRNFDVSRDGKSFIFLKRLAGSQTGEPVVVLNWMEEVKRLMAVAGIK